MARLPQSSLYIMLYLPILCMGSLKISTRNDRVDWELVRETRSDTCLYSGSRPLRNQKFESSLSFLRKFRTWLHTLLGNLLALLEKLTFESRISFKGSYHPWWLMWLSEWSMLGCLLEVSPMVIMKGRSLVLVSLIVIIKEGSSWNHESHHVSLWFAGPNSW